MNLQDTDLIKLREDVFDNYREAVNTARKDEQEIKKLKMELEVKHNSYIKSLDNINNLKALIEIMILENCDPVTAKLKHEEEIKRQKSETQEFSIIDSKYIYSGPTYSQNSVGHYPLGIASSTLDTYDH